MNRVLLSVLSLVLLGACDEPLAPYNRASSDAEGVAMASSSAPEPVNRDFVIQGYCAFDVRAQVTGKEKARVHPNGTLFVSAPGEVVKLTNLSTDRSITEVITGMIRVTPLENGDISLRMTGRGLLGTLTNFYIIIGNWNTTFTQTGQDVVPLNGTGQKLDICELLG